MVGTAVSGLVDSCVGERNGLGRQKRPEAVDSRSHQTHQPTHLLALYPSMIVPYFTSMFGTSQSGSFPSRR